MIIFQPSNISYINQPQESIMACAQAAGVMLENVCGGNGTCGKCKVKVVIGEFGSITEEEKRCLTETEIAQGYRLACKLVPKMAFRTCEIEIEDNCESKQMRAEETGQLEKEQKENFLKAEREQLKLYEQLVQKGFEGYKNQNTQTKKNSAKQVGQHSANEQYDIQKQHNVNEQSKINEPIHINEQNNTRQQTVITKQYNEKNEISQKKNRYGIAIDIGTTNIEATLWDIEQHTCLKRIICRNEQSKYGADVVSRIAYAIQSEQHFQDSCKVLQNQIHGMISKLEQQERGTVLQDQAQDTTGKLEKNVEKIVVAGNAAMMHFFAGVSVENLAKAPYQTKYKEAQVLKGTMLGAPDADLILLPNIESFVGADTVSVLTYLWQQKKIDNTLIIDIGTNGELALIKGNACYVASTSAGPAFEGATISCGMRAEPGAIRGMTINDQIRLDVIGDVAPKGICGSALIEIVAILYTIGAIDETGYLLDGQAALQNGCPKCVSDAIETGEYGNRIILYKNGNREVALTQKDIRELQLAKAAILAGVETMLETCEMKTEDITKCYLAGAFGTYLNVEAAKTIGLLPDIASDKIEPVGNAALFGACQVLLKEEYFAKSKDVAERAVHISLSEQDRFKELYLSSMNF